MTHPDLELEFTVYGGPAPEPRARPFLSRTGIRVKRDPRADSWKRACRNAALDAMGLERAPRAPLLPKGTPVVVIMEFRFQRPKAHHVARDRSRPLRADAPQCHAIKPDIDNLAKAVMDAMGEWPRHARPILWTDDCQVASLVCRKTYGLPEGVTVSVHQLQPEEHP